MDEEDSLTNELVKEQDQALETAIQEEETWLKELAREENLVIEVETENEESDLAVGFFVFNFFTTVKSVLSCHSKTHKTKVFKTNGS